MHKFIKYKFSTEQTLNPLNIVSTCKNISFKDNFFLENNCNVIKKQWLDNKILQSNKDDLEKQHMYIKILKVLSKSQVLDSFLHKKFPTLKWYSGEGSESMMPLIDSILDKSSLIYICMPHRGRISILYEYLNFKPESLFYKILGKPEAPFLNGFSGDVLSHLFKKNIYYNGDIPKLVTLFPNPSHLEAINPVACGFVKAHQDHLRRLNCDKRDIMAKERPLLVQIHGDAAFAGQGVIYETSNMAELDAYNIHGSIHIVVNNQLGFTAEPRHSRPNPHPTDIAKINQCPVFHVNGDYPETAAMIGDICAEYRNEFGTDIYVNLICYRKYGHNEVDDPTLTNPSMYDRVRKKKPVLDGFLDRFLVYLSQKYTEREMALMDYSKPDYWTNFKEMEERKLSEALEKAKSSTENISIDERFIDVTLFHSSPQKLNEICWDKNQKTSSNRYVPFNRCVWETGLPLQFLKYVGRQSVTIDSTCYFEKDQGPAEDINTEPDKIEKTVCFLIHPHLQKVHVKPRLSAFNDLADDLEEKKVKIDWGTAEALAVGSLLLQGINVRFAGQDCGRGTFSHRHFEFTNQHLTPTLTDTNNSSFSQNDPSYRIIPFNHMKRPHGGTEKVEDGELDIGTLQVINTPLHELGALSFETGYALYNTHNVSGISQERLNDIPLTTLVVWEAQFGDFFNGAQTVIDTFITTTYHKWGLNPGGLVILLPHGMDGAGPEHSSCRIERFLQASNDSEIGHNHGTDHNELFINLTIANPSTTSQYFHLLRSQAMSLKNSPLTAPLIVVAPKILLRYDKAKSVFSEFLEGTHFEPVIDDPTFKDPERKLRVRRLIFCSGKHYYTLVDKLDVTLHEKNGSNVSARDTTAIIRIELLSPFPARSLYEIIRSYRDLGNNKKTAGLDDCIEYVWAQEEHRNQGAWTYVQSRFINLFGITNLIYCGRQASATPATGIGERHKKELEEMLSNSFLHQT